MLIGLDGNEANEVRGDILGRAGVNQYAFKLFWELYRLADKNPDLRFVIFLKHAPKSDLPAENMRWKYEVLSGGPAWTITKLLPRLAFGAKPDVFFSPNHYLPPVPFLPMVCVIHDLGYLEFSEQFAKNQYWQLKYWSAISVAISKYIICPSQSTRNDIVRHYPFALNKVFPIPHGYDMWDSNVDLSTNVVRQVKNKLIINGEYILFLGTLKPSKNATGLIEAFSLIASKFKNLQLVIAGAKGWKFEDTFALVKKYGLTKRVVFTGYVSEKDKPALLKGACVFAQPSFWEGFGMDVLNALSLGKPVVLSKAGSLPEIAGNAGIYVDPQSVKSIAKGLRYVLEMDQLAYNRLTALGKKQVKGFSWRKSALETLEILKKAKRS